MSAHAIHRSSTVGPTVMSLEKFSFATVSDESTSPIIPWKHLDDRNNLALVFETVRSQGFKGAVEEKQRLKVIRRSETLVRKF